MRPTGNRENARWAAQWAICYFYGELIKKRKTTMQKLYVNVYMESKKNKEYKKY